MVYSLIVMKMKFNFGKRKIQKVGYSFLVPLPVSWIKNLDIDKGDSLKIAMGNLFLILEPRGVKLVNCVHDELVFECKAEEAEEVAGIIKAQMEKAGNLFLKDLPC
jgi:hypothetical protein